MNKKMLIDASHAEETRVVIMNEQKLEDFDCETSTKQQIKENVYLARLVRVEPSLQAAFVEFGGNRHGFLAFNEIHPDYYRVPVEDREKILKPEKDDKIFDEDPETIPLEGAEAEASLPSDDPDKEGKKQSKEESDTEERASPLSKASLRPYKIQEVIKRRQVMLVQVIKDERGGKGAALTTFISLAGRYCVLMPNTPRGGGISRKIASGDDRKRLREMIDSFEIPDGMGLIVRTAGLERTKTEIKRDFDYLLKLWEEIREHTLSSTAPALIYAEGDLITRSIRDLYHKDITDVLVEGEEGYKKAKSLMRMLMPSHAKRVQLYKDPQVPLFQRHAVEDKLDNIHSPIVQLPSGGYLVINATEALVAIDINSGRATRERHIEETALKTNSEAAEEIARQLRLRDLAGLIVIDFIDMEVAKNNHLVERRFREALKEDRARIQVGSISGFGLLEMSRQRMRPSLIEASTMPCSQCRGTGLVRSVESSSLRLLRALEKQCVEGNQAQIRAFVPTPVALYLLNQKRASLVQLEARYQLTVQILQDDSLIPPDFQLEISGEKRVESPLEEPTQAIAEDLARSTEDNKENVPISTDNGEKSKKRNRRNRNRNRREREAKAAQAESQAQENESPKEVTETKAEKQPTPLEVKPAVQPRSETRADVKPAVPPRSEAKPDVKPAVRTRREAKPDVKPAVRTRTEAKPDVKPAVRTRTEAKPDVKPTVPPRTEAKPAVKPAVRPRTEAKPAVKPAAQPTNENEATPEHESQAPAPQRRRVRSRYSRQGGARSNPQEGGETAPANDASASKGGERKVSNSKAGADGTTSSRNVAPKAGTHSPEIPKNPRKGWWQRLLDT
jgi:ribonuclease E